MGDTGETFKEMKKLSMEKRLHLEGGRFDYAIRVLKELSVDFREEYGRIIIHTKKGIINFWPYTGWFCGQKPIGGIKGRGIKSLEIEISKLTK